MSTIAEYLAFASNHPDQFVNPPEAPIQLLLKEEEIQEAELQEASRFKQQGIPAEWAQVGIAYQDQYILLLRDAVRFSDGSLGTAMRFANDDPTEQGVVILPVYQGNVLLIRHFRHEARTWHLEVPRGFGMKGLTSEETARQELQEEIGASISRLISLGQVHLDAETDSGCVNLFYADIESYGEIEEQEGITELLLKPVADLERMVREGEITDMFSLVVYTRARLQNLLPAS